MYWCKDNFLTETLFKNFSEEVLKQFKPRDGWYELDNHDYGKGLSGENYKVDAPVRIVGRPYPEEDDFVSSAINMKSRSLPEVVRNIKQYMIEELKFINPTSRMVWFQYHSNKSKVIPHFDNELAGKPREQSFTSILYMHDTWEDDWAGELIFSIDNKPILPKPNRLVVYSRDIEHWVSQVTHNLDDYQRMFLFTAWVTDNDF